MPKDSEYQTSYNNAFYYPLFKRPIHINQLNIAQIVMIYHSTTEWQFESNLITMAQNTPYLEYLRS